MPEGIKGRGGEDPLQTSRTIELAGDAAMNKKLRFFYLR